MAREDDMSISELNVTRESEGELVTTTRVIKGYKIIKCIGSGASGNAYLVKNQEGKFNVLKQIDLRFLDDKEEKQALNEVLILRALSSHRHIIGYIETFTYDNHLYIIMEYADGGNLTDFLSQREKPLSNKQVIEWATQLTLALDFVHSKKVLHRDLKSQNIFITTRKNRLLLGDFGISKVLNATQDMAQTMIGTPSYLSPELYENQPYCSKSDVWALGCIFYEMCTMKLPFEGSNMAAIMMKVLTKDPEPIPEEYEIGPLVMAMLEKDPSKRPSIQHILNFPVIRKTMQKMAAPIVKRRRKYRSSTGRSYKEPVRIDKVPSIKQITAEHVILKKQSSPTSPNSSFSDAEAVRVKINIADIATKAIHDPPIVRVSLKEHIDSPTLINSTFDKPSPETPIIPEDNPMDQLTNIVHTSTPVKMPSKILSPSPILKTQTHHISKTDSPTDELILVVEEKKTPRRPDTYPSPSPLTGKYEDMSNFDDTLIEDESTTPVKAYTPDMIQEEPAIPYENKYFERRKQYKLQRLSQHHQQQPQVPKLPLTRVYTSTTTTTMSTKKRTSGNYASPMSPRSVAKDSKNFLRRRRMFHDAKRQEKMKQQKKQRKKQREHRQKLKDIKKRSTLSELIKKDKEAKAAKSPEFLLVTQFGEKSISNQDHV
mmetsp:Transcript_3997/g.5899  ORF Transcript_3997/g.5899 Transcript_3997/m.5899 type:complete len:656 (-) Transcript_3997:2313-4280(-)